MAYISGSGWSDLIEIQCLLIMKKLVFAKGSRVNFIKGMQKNLCVDLAEELAKIGSPLAYKEVTARVSHYKGADGHNKDSGSVNTQRLYSKYKNYSIKELEHEITKLKAAA